VRAIARMSASTTIDLMRHSPGRVQVNDGDALHLKDEKARHE